LNIYSLGGAIWILALLTWPITTLVVLSAWKRIEPSQLESEPALIGTSLIRWLLWPAARAAIGQAAVLTFVLALNNFAVPAILQVKVFPAELWVRYEANRNFTEALAISWPLVIAPILLLMVWRRSDVNWPRQEGGATARAVRRQLGRGWMWCAGAATSLIFVLSVGLPLAQIVTSGRTWTELPNLLRAVPGTIWNSFALAAATASLCIALGLITWRLPIGLILWLPFLVPGVLLGIATILVFNRKPLALIYPSAAVVVMAFAARYLALGWNVVAHALRTADRDLTDAARLDGASGWSLLRHVHWPQIASQVGAAWYVTYLLCLWDVEALVLIVPPGGETLALRIFNLLHYGHNAQVNAMCVVLLALAIAPLAVWSVAHGMARRWNYK
jgi:iron(III) transport system permease protein